MDGNNVHTSVVIELANQEEPEEQKTYKIDFNERDTPKDYVIDQIFCGENITVYALFEIPEIGSKKSENEILEIQNTTMHDEFRFIHKNSFKKTANKKPALYKTKLDPKDTDYEAEGTFLPRHGHLNRSFHCLKHLGENYEITARDDDDNTELKVLFSKDFVTSGGKQAAFKGVSKGVNTEITQSPKLIEEVQRAITVNYSCGKSEGKAVDVANIAGKASREIIDIDLQTSFSSFSSEPEARKNRRRSSPNFMFVPLIMLEDRFMDHFRRERNEVQPDDKIVETKTRIIPTKVSLGTNTDTAYSSSPTSETEDRRESKSQLSSQCSNLKTEKSVVSEINDERETRNAQQQLKKKGKDTILSEIRKLQGKLNALIKSIEYNDLYLSNNEEENLSEVEELRLQDGMVGDSEALRRNKFDDIPIFSPLTFPSPHKAGKQNPKKRAQNSDRAVKRKTSTESVKTVSSGFVSYQEESGQVQSVRGEEKPKVKLKDVFSGLNINWESAEGWKGVGASKSDANNRCNFAIPKYNCLKKSVSFDLKDDRSEIVCLKKMKNSTFTFEGSLKGNLRIIQNGEAHLGDNLPSKMGNEAKRKLIASKTDLQNFSKDPEAEETGICSKSSKVDTKKSQKEEEGDAKLIYPNDSLMSQKFVQNPAVHFCSTNTVSDGLLKSVKNAMPARGKSKSVNKTEESATRTEPEKPTTPNRACRKTSAMDSDVKKEGKTARKLGTRSKTVEKKLEKKEASDSNKPKSVSGSRKFTVKGTAESKLHVDKLIKKVDDCKPETPNSNKSGKSANEEKLAGKIERLPRPRSQKKELRESTPEATAGKKETEKKLARKKSAPAVEVQPAAKKSLLELDAKENVGPVMVFENAKEVSPDTKAAEDPAWVPSNPSSVVVELLSKKPTSAEELYSDGKNEAGSAVAQAKNGENESQGNENGGSQEKPIVKSVWALTKVLLYEDGTKKLEVLEASLTPPGYSLNPTEKSPADDSSN